MICNAFATVYRSGKTRDECYNLTQGMHEVVCDEVDIHFDPNTSARNNNQQGGIYSSSKPFYNVTMWCCGECVKVGDKIDITDCCDSTSETYEIQDVAKYCCPIMGNHYEFQVTKLTTGKQTSDSCSL